MCNCTGNEHDHPIYATKQYVNDRLAALVVKLVPVGLIAVAPNHTIPDGWLVCNGDEFDTDYYPELFEYLGSDLLPDLRGLAVVGWLNGDDDFNTIGATGGVKGVTLSVGEMPQHHHRYRAPDNVYRTDIPYGTTPGSGTGFVRNLGGATTLTQLIEDTGGNEEHTNLQPYSVRNWIIFSGRVTLLEE